MNNGLSKHTAATAIPIPHTQQGSQGLKPIAVSPGGTPWCETITVTSELAEYWLKANTRNRKVRRSRVKAYARDMKNGKWLFSTQGISFGTDGSLIDGQHRLSAVVASDVPVVMVVWFNVPPTARSVIDIGAPRNLADVAELTNQQAAVTSAMIRGLTDPKGFTMADRIAFYREFSSAIDSTIGRFVTTHKGFTQATVLGAVARASLHLDESDVAQFCAVLQSGIPTDDPRDVTVIRLRDRLLQGIPSTGGQSVLRDIYAITASALKAFSEHRVLSKLNPVSTDPFPIPERTSE